jgi:hypothetical protein
MNRRADIGGLMSKVRARTAQVLDAQGRQSVENVKQSISTPYPPASSPGSAPHLRTGNLHEGVSHSTAAGGTEVSTTITSSRAEGDSRVPFWLENGTKKMAARPYMGPEQQVAGPRARAAHAESLRSVRP